MMDNKYLLTIFGSILLIGSLFEIENISNLHEGIYLFLIWGIGFLMIMISLVIKGDRLTDCREIAKVGK